jgi:phosphoserine phosphatase
MSMEIDSSNGEGTTHLSAPPPTLLYLVRHGETEFNRRLIMQGRRVNSILNETGRLQAEALARRLEGVRFDAAYASTLFRAVETAETIVAQHTGVAVERMADLDEMCWGTMEGEPPSPGRDASIGKMFDHWRKGRFFHRVEEGESILDVQRRGVRAIRRIVRRHPGGTILVVTHGRFLRVLLATILTEYGLDRMEEIQHYNTAVNRIVFHGGTFASELLNCTAHLDNAELYMVD